MRTSHDGPNDMHTQHTMDRAQLPKELEWAVTHPTHVL